MQNVKSTEGKKDRAVPAARKLEFEIRTGPMFDWTLSADGVKVVATASSPLLDQVQPRLIACLRLLFSYTNYNYHVPFSNTKGFETYAPCMCDVCSACGNLFFATTATTIN